ARLLDDGDALRPAYSVTGETVPDEQRLTLPGYPGGQTVAKGNWVTRQFQLDAFGEALQLLAVAAEHDRLDQDGRQAMEVATHAIARQWKRPEAGIWELDDDWWTQSRLSCVAGLQTAAKISPSTGDAGDKLALADTILAETTKRCLHPDGYWQRSPHYTGVDASLLLPPVRGALPASDPRTVGTLSAVRDQLTEDGYVYRFPQEPRPLGEEEGAFLLCGFIMALAEWQQGAYADAFRWFERNRSACGPPALLAEEYDVQQKQLRGNLPQAFVHAALLEAATRLTADGI
ncbi:MAG: glycoside hydrolase family 15 protein, partial [Nocardioidaceae bacterium]